MMKTSELRSIDTSIEKKEGTDKMPTLMISLYITELGKMVDLVSVLENAKTKKEFSVAKRRLHSFLNSIQAMRNRELVPPSYPLVLITRNTFFSSGNISYDFIFENLAVKNIKGDKNDNL